jgi:hypothetical protein
MAYNDSPGRTVYFNGGAVLAGEILVLVVVVLTFVDDVDSPSVNKYEKNASSPNKHVLHNKYIWSRVRRNIDVMLCRSQPDVQYAP